MKPAGSAETAEVNARASGPPVRAALPEQGGSRSLEVWAGPVVCPIMIFWSETNEGSGVDMYGVTRERFNYLLKFMDISRLEDPKRRERFSSGPVADLFPHAILNCMLVFRDLFCARKAARTVSFLLLAVTELARRFASPQ